MECLPSTNGSRRRAVDARGGERAGSGSQEEGEEATGYDREDRRRGRRHKCRHNPDADREGPIAGKEGGRDIEKKGIVGS